MQKSATLELLGAIIKIIGQKGIVHPLTTDVVIPFLHLQPPIFLHGYHALILVSSIPGETCTKLLLFVCYVT